VEYNSLGVRVYENDHILPFLIKTIHFLNGIAISLR
jgi:hypothetical protein